MSETPHTSSARGLVTLACVTAATIVSFARIFPGWSFVTDLAATAIVGHGVAAGLRIASRGHGRRRVPAALGVVGAFAAVGTVTAWRHLPDTLWYRLPTWRTITAAADQLATTWQQIGIAVAPLDFVDGFALIAMLAVGGAAVLADTIAFRSRANAESLLPMGVVFITVSIVGYDRSRAAITSLWLATALIHVALGRVARTADDNGWIGARRGAVRAWSALGVTMAVVAAVLAGVAGPRLPGADAEPLLEPRVRQAAGSESLAPLVDVRGRLVNASDIVLFSVRTERPAYWRVAGLSEFDGSTWKIPSDELKGAGGDLADDRPFAERLEQTVVIERLDGNLAPVAASPTALRSSTVDLYFASDSGTLVVADPGLSNGDEYKIVSSTPTPPPDVLDTLWSTNRSATVLPDSWDPALTFTAEQVTRGAATPYRRAIALQNWFRSEFTYDLDVSYRSSVDAIGQFLEARRGYCEQFAGAFAALARSIGLPARVAIGFTPGDKGADGVYRVRGRHAHAWPEVWFDGVGWIGFEPTPGRGDPASVAHTGVAPAQDDGGTPPPIDSSVAPATTAVADAGAAPSIARPGDIDPNAPDAGEPSSSHWQLVVLSLLGIAVAWMALMPLVVRRRVRRRLHRIDPDLAIVDIWNSSVTAMALAGVRVDSSATPREAASLIARQSGLDRLELLELATATTSVIYDDTPLDQLARRRARLVGEHVRQSALAVVPFSWRVRSRIDPRVARRLLTG